MLREADQLQKYEGGCSTKGHWQAEVLSENKQTWHGKK